MNTNVKLFIIFEIICIVCFITSRIHNNRIDELENRVNTLEIRIEQIDIPYDILKEDQ